MKKWEYKSVARGEPLLDEYMREMGLAGWEFYHIEVRAGNYLLFAKREIMEAGK